MPGRDGGHLKAVLGSLAPLAGAIFGMVGCAGPATQIVTNRRDIAEASGRPSIASVVDLGGSEIPLNGSLRLRDGDGVAVVGETLWIRGRSFGRQPTVQIGGRAAAVLSRTVDEGILVRLPPMTPGGLGAVVVSQEHGSAEHPIEVRRYVGVVGVGADRVVWLAVGPDGAKPAGETAIAAARGLVYSADGRAAYVISGTGSIAIIEMPASGQPRLIDTLVLGTAPIRALLSASSASRLVVVRDNDVILLDTRSPLRPVEDSPRPLPPTIKVGGPTAFALSPDGRLLAVAVAERNRVVLLHADRVQPSQACIAGDVALVPEVRDPLAMVLAFSPDGETLWAAAGMSGAPGAPPTQTSVFSIRLNRDGGDVRTEVKRSVNVDTGSTPLHLSTGTAPPLASGASVRLPPERATVYLSTRRIESDRVALLAVGAADVPDELFLSEPRAVAAATDMTPDGVWLLGALQGSEGMALSVIRADGRPGAKRGLSLGTTGIAAAKGASLNIRIQP